MFKTVLEKMVDLATAAFGLAAALAWNDLIKRAIDDFITPHVPKGWGLLSQLVYAAAVTALAVWVTVYLGRLTAFRKTEERENAEEREEDPLGRTLEEAVVRALRRVREEAKGPEDR